ncbi:P-loop containing nucleoside triphosphate hydrolase protein [Filobasidium floriforme]|uniref:P-loop containing nucleoside triphosphate hydrolase protein n=1 Tax=Filobasidium floriforme TaxID=5210 RepID=UPI001E8D99E6|nr:P-loop containing nucleoside triphosphate hydrolase protein [Filobasidium floriforme]KAH8081467.1 P-loop containing nucleoside triphosphate hydrolase protein [Filobasidium floriforme]
MINPGRLGPEHQKPTDTHVLHDRLNTLFGGDLFAGPPQGAAAEHYAVIATGISGAGKTTVMREILNMLSDSDYAENKNAIIKLEKSMIITDALGNARTKNNDDSSRMIKSIQTSNLGRDPRFVVSAMMLEYTRVHCLRSPSGIKGKEERSFHIFYYLFAHGHRALDFDLIQELYPQGVRSDDDGEQYHKVNDAMKLVAGEQDTLPALTWNGLAGVALLMAAKNGSDPKVKSAFELVQYWDMELSLPKGKTRTEQAELDELYARGKAIYRPIFEFWTGKASRLGKSREEKGRVITFFDICGFESLEKNRLAQLLVNDFYEKVDDIAAAKSASQGSSKHPGGISCDQTSAHFLINEISKCRTSRGLDEALLNAKAQDKNRISIKGPPGKLQLSIKHLTEAVEVQYDHTTFLSDDEDERHRKFLDGCRGLAAMLASPPSNDIKRHTTTASMLNDWRNAQSILSRAHVLVINCIKASSTLSPWLFDDKQGSEETSDYQQGAKGRSDDKQGVKAQMINLATVQTMNLMRSIQMDKEDTKANFAARYACLLPVSPPNMGFVGQAERAHNTTVSVIGWVSDKDDKAWNQSCLLLANKVYCSQIFADRLDELVKAQDEQEREPDAPPAYIFHSDEEKDQEIRATVSAALDWYCPDERPSDRHVSEIFDLVIHWLVQHLGDCTMVIPNVFLQNLLRDTIISEAQLRLIAAGDSDLGIEVWNQFSARLIALARGGWNETDLNAPARDTSVREQQQACLRACLRNASYALLADPSHGPDQSDWMRSELFLLVGQLSRA